VKESERRNGNRVPVHLWVEERAGNDVHYHQAADVSATGLYLRKSLAYAVGTQLKIRFSLPNDSHVIHADAEVVRYRWDEGDIQEMGMGLRFLQLPEADQERLSRFLAQAADAPAS
jgi:uncharacterized protein (TIGR02266 family)